jgi:hypothetical protein
MRSCATQTEIRLLDMFQIPVILGIHVILFLSNEYCSFDQVEVSIISINEMLNH